MEYFDVVRFSLSIFFCAGQTFMAFVRSYQAFSTVTVPYHLYRYLIVHFLCIFDHSIHPPLTEVFFLVAFSLGS